MATSSRSIRSPRVASAAQLGLVQRAAACPRRARATRRGRTPRRARWSCAYRPSRAPSCRPGRRAVRAGHPPGWGGRAGRRRRGVAGSGRASRVPAVPTRPGLLECIERYFAAAPLPDARIEAVGGLDVPIGDPAWPYPARPRAGGGPVTADDVRAAVALQEEAGLPAALEWVPERSPETRRGRPGRRADRRGAAAARRRRPGGAAAPGRACGSTSSAPTTRELPALPARRGHRLRPPGRRRRRRRRAAGHLRRGPGPHRGRCASGSRPAAR